MGSSDTFVLASEVRTLAQLRVRRRKSVSLIPTLHAA